MGHILKAGTHVKLIARAQKSQKNKEINFAILGLQSIPWDLRLVQTKPTSCNIVGPTLLQDVGRKF